MSDYNSHFTLSTKELVATRNDTEKRQDIYKENLSPLSKDELINIAIEGHKNYQWANGLAYERGLEIENLNKEIQYLNDNLAIKNRKIDNYKAISIIVIGICVFSVSIFYIYQYIKHRLKKYADKIRNETIEELNKQ